MNKIAINLGPLTITWYSICILTGIIVAAILIVKEAKKFNISSNFVTNLIFWCVIFGIVGARIYYVLFNLDYYSASPLEVIKIWNGGLAIHGGIIGGVITLILYCRKYNVNPLRMADIAAPSVLVAQALGRWGNFFNSEAHGGMVSKSFLQSLHIPNFIIKGMYINGNYYHPTFLYESLLCIVGFIILMIYRKTKNNKVGNTISLYLVWYGIIRFFIESLRTDSLMLGSLKMAQVISIIMIITGIVMFVITKLKNDNYNNKNTDYKK
ncbi:MAG: prolipoprotein diacylglyceryl transferase [Bacilli bacterium]|nr:prolipoprotein diacylglyceryl transferase [Bacilli bacterium]